MAHTITIILLLLLIVLLFFVIGAQSDCIDKYKYDIKHKDRIIQELRTQNDHLRYYVTRKDLNNKTYVRRQ